MLFTDMHYTSAEWAFNIQGKKWGVGDPYRPKSIEKTGIVLTSPSAWSLWAECDTFCSGWRACWRCVVLCSAAAGCWAPAVCSAGGCSAPSSRSTGRRTCWGRRTWEASARSSETHLEGREKCKVRAGQHLSSYFYLFFFAFNPSSGTGCTNSQFSQTEQEPPFAKATWAEEPQAKVEVILFDAYANGERQS